MPSEKRSREQRRANPEQRKALEAAVTERDRDLAKLRAKLQPKIEALQTDWRDGRREVWDAYQARCDLIRQATMLTPA